MHYGELIDSWIEGLTVRYTKQEFFEEAQRRGITVAPVNAALDVLHDPQLQATGGWQTPEPAGPRFPTPPVSIDGVRSQTGAVPRAGEHNHEVFVRELGLDDDELAALCATAVI